jgi:hypothetical protein
MGVAAIDFFFFLNFFSNIISGDPQVAANGMLLAATFISLAATN